MPDTFQVNNQQIPWSFFHKVAKKYGLHRAQELFYLYQGKRNIMRYILAGMKHEWFSNTRLHSPQMDAFIRKHFDKNIPKEKKRVGTQKIDSISKVLEEM